jgi:hypothetical protein
MSAGVLIGFREEKRFVVASMSAGQTLGDLRRMGVGDIAFAGGE